MTSRVEGESPKPLKLVVESEEITLEKLPVEDLYKIFTELKSFTDVAHLSLANWHFSAISQDPTLWKIFGRIIGTNVELTCFKDAENLVKKIKNVLSSFKLHDEKPMNFSWLHTIICAKDVVLTYKKIYSVPSEIDVWHKLESLNLSYTSIQSLPPEVGKLKQLKILDVSHNGLDSVPEELGECEKLEFLHLSFNNIRPLPPSLSRLKQLIGFYADHNNLTELSFSVRSMAQLSEFWIQVNNLRSIPSELRRFEGRVAEYVDGDALEKDGWVVFD